MCKQHAVAFAQPRDTDVCLTALTLWSVSMLHLQASMSYLNKYPIDVNKQTNKRMDSSEANRHAIVFTGIMIVFHVSYIFEVLRTVMKTATWEMGFE